MAPVREYGSRPSSSATHMTNVVNKKTHNPSSDDVYIGRPSKWGNPFIIGRDGNRDEVVDKYAEWLSEQPHLLKSLSELHGKNLVCWCSPERCHGDVLKFACTYINESSYG